MSEKPEPDFWTLEPSYPETGYAIATAAIRSCSICGAIVDGMGGPGNGSFCNPCASDIQTGRIRRFVDVRALCITRKSPTS